MRLSNEYRNVRFWHLADMTFCTAHVRFRSKSGHDFLRCERPLLTQSGHTQTLLCLACLVRCAGVQ